MSLEMITRLPDGNGGIDDVPHNALWVNGLVEEAFVVNPKSERFVASEELVRIIEDRFAEKPLASLVVRALNTYMQNSGGSQIKIEGRVFRIEDDLPSEIEHRLNGRSGHLLITIVS